MYIYVYISIYIYVYIYMYIYIYVHMIPFPFHPPPRRSPRLSRRPTLWPEESTNQPTTTTTTTTLPDIPVCSRGYKQARIVTQIWIESRIEPAVRVNPPSLDRVDISNCKGPATTGTPWCNSQTQILDQCLDSLCRLLMIYEVLSNKVGLLKLRSYPLVK